MIIVEGMDGTGKSSLVTRLAKDLKIPIHARAATSVGGPVKNLYEWVEEDVTTFPHQPFSVYDRHPLISDFVYGPVLRGRMDERFHSSEASILSRKFVDATLVILCDPGISEVNKNVTADELNNNQLEGVAGQWRNLYWAYKALIHYWPGDALVWDYRYHTLYPSLLQQCVQFMALRKGDFNG